MSVFALRLPEDLKEMAATKAAEAGLSLNQYIALAVATRVGAQVEADRYFATRAARAVPGRAKSLLTKAGLNTPPRDDDRLEDKS